MLGTILGGISGVWRGSRRAIRVIGFLRSVPTIPVDGLAAACPRTAALRIYFTITVILSIIGWTTGALGARGFSALREDLSCALAG